MGLAVLAAFLATLFALAPALARRRGTDPRDPMTQQNVDQMVDTDPVPFWCFAAVSTLAATVSLVEGSPTWPLWMFTTVVLLVAVRLVRRNNA